MESTKTLRAYLAVLIAVVTVLIILVPFILVIHQSCTESVRLGLEQERAHLSGVTAMSRQYILEFMQRLTERAGNAGETLSAIGPELDAVERYFQHVGMSTDTDAWLIFSSDGALFYGDTANGALFSDTARRAQISGCSAVSEYIDCADKLRRIGVAAPFTAQDGGVWAVVFLYGQSTLDKMLADTQAEGVGSVSIVDEKADILASSRADTPWAGQGRIASDGSDLPKDAPFTLEGANDGKTYRAYASVLGINDWLVVYAMPEGLFGGALRDKLPRIYLYGGLTVLCLMLAGGLSAHRSMLGENRLELFKKKFMIAASQSARAAFEYNRRTDRLTFISQSEHVRLPRSSLSLMELSAAVHPQDRPIYYQSVADLRGKGTTSVTVRLMNFGGKDVYRWYHVTATRLTDKGEGKALTIGTVEDIDEQENERLILHERATTDGLTGLSNRAETEKAVGEQLARLDENDSSVFVLLDLDGFKDINDKYGHDCGDKALIFFSNKLRSTFRFGDILGRLGGDEFVVYMTLTAEKEVVERRLKGLMESLVSWNAGDDCGTLNVTCSIGCCMAVKGDTFESVYKRADDALYQSKSRGKNQYTIID